MTDRPVRVTVSADESAAIDRIAVVLERESAELGGPIGQLFSRTAAGWRATLGVLTN
jgi:hypothetical protein